MKEKEKGLRVLLLSLMVLQHSCWRKNVAILSIIVIFIFEPISGRSFKGEPQDSYKSGTVNTERHASSYPPDETQGYFPRRARAALARCGSP